MAWGDELIKRDVPFVNEVLRQLVTLSAGLLAAHIALYSQPLMRLGFKIAIAVLFLLALAIALAGTLPHRRTLHRRAPYQIKREIEIALRLKLTILRFSAGFLLLGLLLALVGVIASNP